MFKITVLTKANHKQELLFIYFQNEYKIKKKKFI